MTQGSVVAQTCTTSSLQEQLCTTELICTTRKQQTQILQLVANSIHTFKGYTSVRSEQAANNDAEKTTILNWSIVSLRFILWTPVPACQLA